MPPVFVHELQPGDLILNADMSATFITQSAHPLYPGMRLVIWLLRNGEWSFDALSAGQVVGVRGEPTDKRAREHRLREALNPDRYSRIV